MPVAVPAPLDRRLRASPLFRRICAVPSATVRNAGLPHGSEVFVGAAAKHALAWTAAVFCADALAFRAGGAARHGARLVSTTVCVAIPKYRCCVGGAPFKLARSTCTMLATDTACSYKSGAAFFIAHFPFATTMFDALAFKAGDSRAIVERAELWGGAMFFA